MGITKFIAFAVILFHVSPVSCDHSTAAHTSFSVFLRGGEAEEEPSNILDRTLRIVPEEIIGISPLQVAVTTKKKKQILRAEQFG